LAICVQFHVSKKCIPWPMGGGQWRVASDHWSVIGAQWPVGAVARVTRVL
jgi:hypothetical protein